MYDFHCLGVYAAARSSVPARAIAGAYMGHAWGTGREEEGGVGSPALRQSIREPEAGKCLEP